jgi:hypothetical protein
MGQHEKSLDVFNKYLLNNKDDNEWWIKSLDFYIFIYELNMMEIKKLISVSTHS